MSRNRLITASLQSGILVLLLYITRNQEFRLQIAIIAISAFFCSLLTFIKEDLQKRRADMAFYKKLIREKQRADLIADSISDGIILLRDRKVIYANSIAEKILGLPEGTSVMGFDVGQATHQCLTPGVEILIQSMSSCFPSEFTLKSPDRKRHYLVQACPIQHEKLSIHQDEELANEIQLAQHEDVQPDVLILAQDITLLKESQEAKIHFLGTLSHEVKTPVTSLTMAIHLLKKGVAQFPSTTHQNLILTCAQDIDRLRALIEDLMTVSRFDILAHKLELQQIDLGKLLSHAVQSFRMQAREKEIDLSDSIDVSPKSDEMGKRLLITVDATKIAWALTNLLTNALRHTPRGGKVGVSLIATAQWAEIRVKDTGPGIELFRQKRIFEKFNPYYDLRVGRSGSAGAGLAIAREIINAHGGEIWVTSRPGEGSEFGFRLPRESKSAASDVMREDFSGQAKRLAPRLVN